jgi:RimJ/RimL family protein N-acetyltransferase
MSDGRLAADDLPRLLALAGVYEFDPYRNYRVFSNAARRAVLAAEIEATLRHADGRVHLHESGAGSAAVVARRLAWDSGFFGVPMARIEYLVATDPAACREALRACLASLRAEGVRHVAARVDVADLAAIALLEDHGFRLRDALVTYASRPGKEPAKPVRSRGRIRPFRDDDVPELLDITREAFRDFRSRFHADPALPRDRVDGFYEEWARQSFAGVMADRVIVSEGSTGTVLGYLAFRRREPVSALAGIPVFGGGLGACRRSSPGAFNGLIHAGTEWAHEQGGVAECQTQSHNFPSIRVYEAVGAHYVRGEYTLHATLGGR